MQLKSLMYCLPNFASNASNPQWLLASKFSNRCSAQCFTSLAGSGGLTIAHMRQVP